MQKRFTTFNTLELKGITLITNLNFTDSTTDTISSNSSYIYDNKNNYFIKGRPCKYIENEFKRIKSVRNESK